LICTVRVAVDEDVAGAAPTTSAATATNAKRSFFIPPNPFAVGFDVS
jgi:hypothetical protein